MTIIVGMYRGGIIVAEASAESALILNQAFRQGIEGGVEAIDAGQDAKDLWQAIENSFSGNGLEATKIIGSAAFGSAVTIALVESGAAAAAIGAAAFAAGIVLSPALLATAAIVAGAAAGYYAGEYYGDIFDELKKRGELISGGIDELMSSIFTAARTWIAPPPPRRIDPLVLDLDGDGIETVGLNGASSVLFDHTGNGIKTATGWVGSDDGFLVLDRNGNGLIDSGSELFGVDTVLANGQHPADGFAALTELDSNSDGVFDDQDTQYVNVRVWRDLNQDGVSESGELKSLADTGVVAISLNATAAAANLGNGNSQTAVAGFMRTDGSSGTIANLNFAGNDFYRQFATPVALTPEAEALPGIQGSGMVRDLREAASLSPTLAAAASAINGAMTPQQMRAQVDTVLAEWADTSTMETGIEQASDLGLKLFYLTPGTSQADVEEFRDLLGGNPTGWSGATRTVADLSESELQRYQAVLAQQQHIDQLIGVLERFDAETFVQISAQGVTTGAGSAINPIYDTVDGTQVNGRLYLGLSQAQVNLLNQSYQTLQDSIYNDFAMTTWVKPYVDEITLNFDISTGLSVDFSAMDGKLDALFQTDARSAIVSLIELNRLEGDSLQQLGWGGLDKISDWVNATASDLNVQSALSDLGVIYGSGTLNAASGDNLIVGLSSTDTITAGAGNDTIYGGDGNDTITDSGGTNTIDGGAGTDTV
ncbi:MAG: hypothetical protein M0P39_09705, partial [Rhodocyclaceae bacterium]|nr:hypothetical protein [Rhodocyclaceae bacterium]